MGGAVEVRRGNGVELARDGALLALDPDGPPAGEAVISHAHLDHLKGTRGARRGKADAAPPGAAWMTPPTLDLLRVRKPGAGGRSMGYGAWFDAGGFSVRLHDAGHVLGSAMVEAEGVLYTGDFNPVAGLLSKGAEPVECDTLVIESTYGDPRMELPPRGLVLETLEAWALRRLVSGSVALGSHPLGRAQELIALMNRAGVVPVVSADVAVMTAVYNAHGADLAWVPLGSPRARELEGRACYIVPRSYLRKGHDFARRLRAEGGAAAYLSGWCHRFSYFRTYDIEAQFTLSDHAGFADLLAYAEAVRPKRVYTVHGEREQLAGALEERLGVPCTPL